LSFSLWHVFGYRLAARIGRTEGMRERNIGTSEITMPLHELTGQNTVTESQAGEIQNARLEIAELRSKLQQQELNFEAQRRAWQCELAEKQLLLQGRNAEIEQSRSEIAALRKRVRELESPRHQAPVYRVSDALQTQPGLGSKVAAREKQKSLNNDVGEAGRDRSENGSQEFADAGDDDFVLGEPRITDVQEISFARLETRVNSPKPDTKTKSSKIFPSGRWRIRGQKRRWKILNGGKKAEGK
jgi:chromosome segregation ATPase